MTGCGRLLDEDEAKAEARRIGGTAMAMPLYTAPQADSVTAPAAIVLECGNLYAKVKLTNEAFGTTKVGDKFYKMQADSVLEDATRLDWLLLHISGAEFRRIGVHYSGNARRADVDAARNKGANHD